MKHVFRLGLFTALATLLAASSALAGSRLSGSLHRVDDAWMVQSRSTTTISVGDATVQVTSGVIVNVGDKSRNARTLVVEARNLEPSARHLLIINGTPATELVADRTGSLSRRLAFGDHPPSWTPMPERLARALDAPAISVQVLGSDRTRSGAAVMGSFAEADESWFFDWTPLCSNDPRLFGGAMISQEAGFEYFAVNGEGLEPGASYTIRANGIEVGQVTADDWGSVWLEAASTSDAGLEWVIPAELLPVTGISAVEVVAGDTAVLAGDFSAPCEVEPVEPYAWGSFSLCSEEEGASFGWLDWVMLDEELQLATITAFGLQAGLEVDLFFDGIAVGSGTVDDAGMLWLAFSTDPTYGELPLPEAVLPLNELDEVVVSHDGDQLLAGSAEGLCGGIEPPLPVDSAVTPLCPAGDGEATRPEYGEAGWAVYEDGTEELWILFPFPFMELIYPETPAEITLVVDGHELGEFTAGADGFFYLWFVSDPAFEDQHQLPAELSPVSTIKEVALFADDEALATGSFDDPCQIPEPPLPPMPVDSGYTGLCPADDTTAFGELGWTIYDSGDEDLWLMAMELPPGAAAEVVVDGVVLGSFEVDDFGYLWVSFATYNETWWYQTDFCAGGKCGGGSPQPLPEAIRPVSDIEQVTLLIDSSAVLAGSFLEPCQPSGPQVPVESASTRLCAADPSGAWGDASWSVYDNGHEELLINVFPVEGGREYTLIVDGVNLGSFAPDPEGFLFLYLTSDVAWEGQLQLPDSVRPVSDLDTFELLTPSGATLVAGSFSEPCEDLFQTEAGFTALCDPQEVEGGFVSWWLTRQGDEINDEGIEVMAWLADPQTLYTLEIDGVGVGQLQPDPAGTLYLCLGTSCELAIPQQLQPLSKIDSVRILDEQGDAALEGSFADPCGEGVGILPLNRRNRHSPGRTNTTNQSLAFPH